MHKFIINDFEGPMDLLLHLVKQADIDIYDINLVDLVNQYLDFIKEMEKLELNVASEYIVVASELIELKSRALLPVNKALEETEESPREELINRLLEYKKYKELAPELRELENARKTYFSKEPSSLKEFRQVYDEKGDITLLLNAFNEFMLKKREENIVTKATTKEYSVKKRGQEILALIKEKGQIEFKELFSSLSREFIIVTFLALLEMVKSSEINIMQSANFSEIYIMGVAK